MIVVPAAVRGKHRLALLAGSEAEGRPGVRPWRRVDTGQVQQAWRRQKRDVPAARLAVTCN